MGFRSIRWRLVSSYMLLTVLAVSLVAALALTLIQRHAQQQELSYLTSNAQGIARQVEPLMLSRPNTLALRRLVQTSAFVGNVRVRLLNTQSLVIADSGPRDAVDEFVWVLPPESADGLDRADPEAPLMMSLLISGIDPIPLSSVQQLPAGSSYVVVRRIDGPWGSRFVLETYRQGETPKPAASVGDGLPRSDRQVRVPVGDTAQPLGYVELGGAPDFGGEALATTARAFLIAGIGATLIAGVVGLAVSRSLTSPVETLTAAAGRMTAGDLTARATVSSRDEIGQLAGQFNQMAAELQRSFVALGEERDALRRFVADASHELRTPITALKLHNELMQGAAAGDPAAREEFLAESQRQIQRLEWITTNLLNLSRLDAGLVQLELKNHAAAEIIQAAILPHKLTAQGKGVDLVMVLPGDSSPGDSSPGDCVQARCDLARMELALSNLVDNAVKFTPAGGRVVVGAKDVEKGDGVRFWVQDDGPGIDPQDQSRIFERFYRGKTVRASGSGLGLAIVKSIVQAHGGQVTVRSAPGQGSRFEITLPGNGAAAPA